LTSGGVGKFEPQHVWLKFFVSWVKTCKSF